MTTNYCAPGFDRTKKNRPSIHHVILPEMKRLGIIQGNLLLLTIYLLAISHIGFFVPPHKSHFLSLFFVSSKNLHRSLSQVVKFLQLENETRGNARNVTHVFIKIVRRERESVCVCVYQFCLLALIVDTTIERGHLLFGRLLYMLRY